MTSNVKLIVAYEGTHYYGWQKTKTGPSIEEELEKALATILRQSVSLQAASRTDRGVHAKGQVVNFVTDKPLDLKRLEYSLNCLLPDDIRIFSLSLEKDSFHPTLDVIKKQYRYFVRNTLTHYPEDRLFSWHIPKPLDHKAMVKAAKYFVGVHDFAAFCNEIKENYYENTFREIIRFDIEKNEDSKFSFIIEGNHFLYKMVRNMVGAVVYAGLNKIEPESIPSILSSKKRASAKVTAPALGLTLYKVFYS